MKWIDALFIAVLIVAGGVRAACAADTFNLDKDHTYVGFSVSYLIFARVSGRFDDFEGSFVIDREHPENNRADIIIQTTSVDTGIEARDVDIRGPGLFNTDHYPTMLYHSDKIEMISDDTGQIIGNLTLLGITKPVTLDLVKGEGEDKRYPYGFKVTGEIKRSDFGMNAFIRPIGNTVTLLVCYNMVGCDGDRQKAKKPRYNQ